MVGVLIAEGGSAHSDSSSEKSGDDDDFAMMSEEVCNLNETLEGSLSNKTFLRIWGYLSDRKAVFEKIDAASKTEERPLEFNGTTINTGGNRRSFVSLQLYMAHYRE